MDKFDKTKLKSCKLVLCTLKTQKPQSWVFKSGNNLKSCCIYTLQPFYYLR
uniref:Uncharacterized protein n=1 Tax=Anguilla anguilla TaxID=7936 RepID=A0A0E9RRX4_ANGAN